MGISSKIQKVKTGKSDRIYLKNKKVFSFSIDSSKEGMEKFKNIRVNKVIHIGDSIVKNKNSLKIRVYRNSSPDNYFDLLGRGSIIR
ncbi:MAG: CxxC motif-containing protein [Crocinitomicaceae bacterium]|jgi:CxxC motif-containing protein